MAKPKSATTGPTPTKQNCATCKFSRKEGTYCYRYPKPELVAPTHWCGEWNKPS